MKQAIVTCSVLGVVALIGGGGSDGDSPAIDAALAIDSAGGGADAPAATPDAVPLVCPVNGEATVTGNAGKLVVDPTVCLGLPAENGILVGGAGSSCGGAGNTPYLYFSWCAVPPSAGTFTISGSTDCAGGTVYAHAALNAAITPATGGTVTIEAASDGCAVGTFDVLFDPDEMTGTFSATTCAPI